MNTHTSHWRRKQTNFRANRRHRQPCAGAEKLAIMLRDVDNDDESSNYQIKHIVIQMI